MTGELRLSTLAGLVAGMGLATLGFYEPLPLWLPLPLLALVVWRLRWSWLGRPAPRVPQLVKLACLTALGLALWASGRFGIGIDGMGAGFIVLLWSKLLEMRSARDFHHTAAIALFVVALQLLSSQTFGQCLFAIASILVLLTVQAQFHIVGDTASPWVDARPWRTWLRAGRSGATLVGQALPFAVALFICLPRPPSTGLNRPMATSGVTDSLAPGSVAKVALDTTPAFRVDFAGAVPSPVECYWRGVILWNTDGETWGRGNAPSPRDGLVDPLPGPRGALTYEVTLQPQNQRWIYLLDAPMGVEAAMAGDSYALRVGMVFESPRPITSTRRYRGEALVGGASMDDPSDLDPFSARRSRHRAGEEPELSYVRIVDADRVDARTKKLASDLRAQSLGKDGRVDAERAIAATLAWFKANGFVYTLEPGQMGPNGTATFLFERRRGFCEHYANAFGVLMRLMQVPTRVVVGYYGGEINQLGGFMTVRQANAHAWDEVWVDGRGWRRVDATEVALALDAQGNPIPQDEKGDPAAFAGSRGTGGWAQRHLKWLLQRWDYVEAQWDRWALTYDQDSLASLQRALGLERLGALGPVLMLAAVCLPLLALVLLLMRRRRAGDPAVAAYAAFCERLARAGIARAPAEGPLDFARRAAAGLPEQHEAIARIVATYADLRYGPPQPPHDRRSSLTRFSRDVRAFKPQRKR
jgi:transglutaminase-like putative cysteine protease